MERKLTQKPAYSLRTATDADHSAIYDVLEEVGSEIPIELSDETRAAAEYEIVTCCASGRSLVAIDDHQNVVGFALARPDLHTRGAVSLRYIGVSKDWRKSGIFAALTGQLLKAGAPLVTTVLTGNKSRMVELLTKKGFVQTAKKESEANFRWDPAPPKAPY
ncbi:GNAT family N-acetyltransferase [Tardiphaga sp. 71_E8_N1_1]|uniref:GNAT family N-acetyltransferase n=1 Tax=Tardiphaga sp. 71_E8_N1_1 TaxID=3240784 RepID=UPI003F88CB93